MDKIKIIDMHQDLMLYVSRPDLHKDHGQTSFEKIKANNLKVVVASAFPAPENDDFLSLETNRMIEDQIGEYGRYVRDNPEFETIRSAADLERVMDAEGKFGLILHVEGLNAFEESNGWEMLERWYGLGLRSIGPLWNINNPFGGGTLDSERGLTPLGEKLVKWCEEKNIILDFAHMNEKTFWDAAKIVTRPILVSHGNAYEVCKDPRNYSDAQLAEIGKTNGAIGIFLSKKFLTKEPVATPQTVKDHVDRMMKIAGPASVGIGSDFGGILSGFAEGMESVDSLQGFLSSLEGINIESMAHKNALRVIGRHLGK
jgi:membrane dipeptidase